MAGIKKAAGEDPGIKMVCRNRRAGHLYELLEEFEAGLVLTGTEVKSLREGKASLPESYAVVRDGEMFLVGCHINEYTAGNRYNHDPVRDRKLLLSAREIRRLVSKVEEKGLTLVPLSIYFRGSWAKVKLALGRGKKLYDKRQDIKRREADRETSRAMRREQNG
ncbi:MAG: SsrA-binding protein SmpB [Gemmatimonadota bacterium]|nr:SsrA-binding protein SmpB [Gemmatimonadota bacterium]